MEATKGLAPPESAPKDRDRDERKGARCDDVSAVCCDVIRDPRCCAGAGDPIEDLCKAIKATALSCYSDEVSVPAQGHIRAQLERHRKTIEAMNSNTISRLRGYLESRFVEPCARVGTVAAQSVMHGATQGQLSAFHRAGDVARNRNRYAGLTDALELRCSGCICSFSPKGSIRAAMRRLALVRLSEIVTGRRRSEVHKPRWSSIDVEGMKEHHKSLELVVITLDRAKMAQYGILASDVRSSLGRYVVHNGVPQRGQQDTIVADVSPNIHACIYVYYTHYASIHTLGRFMETAVVSSGGVIRDLKRIVTDHGVHLECPSVSLRHVMAYDDLDTSTLFCNDVKEVYSAMGISACFHLIRETIMHQADVSEEDALLVAGYMTWSGCPRPFVKQSVKDEYGPMFDMYYERPRHTLVEWAEREHADLLNNPYARVMVGTQDGDFSVISRSTRRNIRARQ